MGKEKENNVGQDVSKRERIKPVAEAIVKRKMASYIPSDKRNVVTMSDDIAELIKGYKIPHPGRCMNTFITGYIKNTGTSFAEFCRLINKDEDYVNSIIKGKNDIDLDFAVRLSMVLKTSIHIWMNWQTDHNKVKDADFQKVEYVRL